MRVVMLGNLTHVVVHVVLVLEEFRHHRGQAIVKVRLDVVARIRVVGPPHHHRHATHLAFGDPTDVVLVEPFRQSRLFTQFASHAPHSRRRLGASTYRESSPDNAKRRARRPASRLTRGRLRERTRPRPGAGSRRRSRGSRRCSPRCRRWSPRHRSPERHRRWW